MRDPVPRGTRNVGFRLGLEPFPPIKGPQSDRLTAETMGVKEGGCGEEGRWLKLTGWQRSQRSQRSDNTTTHTFTLWYHYSVTPMYPHVL